MEVAECRFRMTEDFASRLKSVKGIAGPAGFALSLLASVPVLAWRFLRAPRADAILVPYPGVFHLGLVRILRLFRHRRAPVVLDLFFSLHEALVADRRLLRETSLPARALFLLERWSCRWSDLVLTDTEVHADWAAGYFRLPRSGFAPIPVGPAYPPLPPPSSPSLALPPGDAPAEPFSVLFVGTYIPLHGVETILDAASLLARESGIRFLLVGRGQLRGEMEKRARGAGAPVEFRDWVPTAELARLYRGCGVALGVFGLTGKAGRVIPSKVFDICAAGAPFITADTPAIREVFRDGENASLVPPGDPVALAAAILRLRDAPGLRSRLAAGAHQAALDRFSRAAIGTGVKGRLGALLEKSTPSC